jgi:hypothetical protein
MTFPGHTQRLLAKYRSALNLGREVENILKDLRMHSHIFDLLYRINYFAGNQYHNYFSQFKKVLGNFV